MITSADAPSPAPSAFEMTSTAQQSEEVQAAEVVQAEIQEGVSVSYKIGSGIDIPGDNSPRKTTIASFNLPPELDFVTSPRRVPAAYRRAKIANTSPLMLLEGKAQLFHGEDFIGATQFKRISTGQEIELYFGVDDRIFVQRELVKRDTDKKLLGDQRRIRYAYEITLGNHTGEKQTISVWDQIPVSRHENIKVKMESADPKVNNHDELNRLEWKLDLTGGGKQSIRYVFTIEYPRDMHINGLP
ncbi:MAG: DUF4139 domain-containing protein [Anaerolineae bacterium]|nr:DUF4139 domain-containing protein [Anaerolineae bacterium]